jgi:hypothetical protein
VHNDVVMKSTQTYPDVECVGHENSRVVIVGLTRTFRGHGGEPSGCGAHSVGSHGFSLAADPYQGNPSSKVVWHVLKESTCMHTLAHTLSHMHCSGLALQRHALDSSHSASHVLTPSPFCSCSSSSPRCCWHVFCRDRLWLKECCCCATRLASAELATRESLPSSWVSSIARASTAVAAAFA